MYTFYVCIHIYVYINKFTMKQDAMQTSFILHDVYTGTKMASVFFCVRNVNVHIELDDARWGLSLSVKRGTSQH